ncbi:hypothetical protein IVB18_11715 [Bradyrhizobium sp. 186]|uniref:beta strand repeat-containing protein n=1 Tax=Bradyrhizobium sp. 186 TaxID=2782654 RepID=UPI002001410B|nr:Ig-like domain-containing protein [Bradyrhizobium sp. 186]UPK37904.1 hypothetical protein IVB18_11715 [Bradyrhizobium sp. 186]
MDAGANITTSAPVVFTLDTAAPTVAITSAGGSTNQASQTITGTVDMADAGATVTILDGTTAIGTAIVQGNGTWTTTVTLNQGSNFLTARVSDAAGNTATSGAVVYTLSTTGPTVTEGLVSDTGSSATDHVTSNPAVNGTGLANTVVHFTIDGSAVAATATTDAQGAWSFTPGGLADGSHTIVASQTDSFGNTGSASLIFTLDTSAPTVAITSAGGSTNQASQTITGTVDVADAGATVTILDGTTAIGTAIVQGNGTWTTTVTLNQGSNSLTARVSDAAGNTATSGAVVYTLSTTGPTVTEGLVSDTGSSATDHVTSNPAVNGTGLANTVVHFTIDGSAVAATATTDAQGAWSFTPGGLADGSHTIVASQTDSFGNTGSASLIFTLDTAAPTVAITSAGGSTNQASQTITGTVDMADAGATVTILDGTTAIGTAIVQGNGTWTTTVTLNQGSNSLTARVSDAAGNTATSGAVVYTLSTTGPTVTEGLVSDTGSSATDHVTSNPAVNGTGLANTVVHFTIDGSAVAATATTDAQGAWSFTPGGLADGSHTIVASQTDSFGNTGSASLIFTLDTAAPTVAITSAGGSTNQASQTITGTVDMADAGATVTILDGTTAIGTAIVQGNGTWTTTVTLNQGSNSLTARVSDAAGNTATSGAVVYTLSTTGPTVTEGLVSDTGSSATDHVTSNPAVNGTGLANTVVHFTIDGSAVAATATTDAQGAWSFTPGGLADGSHTIVASQTDSFGNTGSASLIFTLDTSAPTVAITSAGGSTNQASQTITGTVDVADAGATVTILDGTTAIGTAIVQGNGTWTTTVTLNQGSNSLTARVSDAAGNTATSGAVVYTLSTTGPTVTEGLVSDTGSSATDHVTSNPAVNGTGLANTVVHFTIDGSAVAATATTDAQGAWSFTPGGLADGSHTIVASQTDSFGNTGSASLIFTLDTAAPTVAITSAGGSTNQASQTITGTVDVADAGATVTILDGTTAIGTAIVQGNGTWTTTVTLNQGSNSLTARVSDAAGNTATSGAVVYTLSTTGPTVTEGLVSDTGSSATDHVTSNPAVNGTGLANTVVHFTIDGSAVAATATTDAQGAWSFTPGGLADGSHTIVASQTDSFGNTGSASLIFTLDTSAPTVAITSAGGSTNQASQTITGTVDMADAGATVTILDGTTAIGTAIVQGNGTWTTTVTLNQGSNSLTARVSDAAGNTATSGAVVYTLSTTGPTVTEGLVSDTGSSATDHVTSNPAVNGTGLANTVVHFTIDGSAVAATATTDAQGAWSFTPGGLADGSHTIVASQTDSFGNTGSASLIFTLDTSAPTVAITSAGGSTNQASQTITGTVDVADAGATVTILDGTTAIGTAIVQGNGTWTTTVTLNQGSNSLTARVSDAAGNTATSGAVVYTLSTTGPTVTEGLVSDTGSSATDHVTSNPAVNGTGLANTVVHFTIDGSAVAATATTDAQGAWSFTPGGLADGSHTIVASQTDSFGNTGSASLIFTLDTAAPTVAITSAGGSTNQASQTITGTVDMADAGATVTILDGTTAIGTAIVQGNGTWTTTVTLNQGSNSLTARVSDAAGNTATSGAVVYTLSTTGPTVTEGLVSDTGSSATDHVTSNPAVNGTGLANTVVHFTIDGSAVAATATTDAQGAWSFTPGGLADGSHTIVASQTDSFGNTGSASLIFTLDTAAPTVAITSAGGSTNQASQTITGTVDVADAGATVTILDGTTAIGSAVVQGNGTWTTTVTLNQGSNSLTARVSDAAGNTATSGAVVYTLSTTGPTVTEGLVSDTGSSATDHVTSNPAVNGTGLANTVVHFTIDGSAVAATATTDAQGAWSFTPGGLADGSHTIVASQTDSFGNTGSASLIFTLDTSAPTVAITSAGGSTNQASQTITGTVDVADAGATVTILDGTTAIGTAIVQGNGTWTTTVTLNQGSNSLTARVSDAAGNTATSGAVVYTLSTTGPTVTEGLVSDTGSSATDHVTSNPAVNGTGLANTVVHFTIDGSAVAATATTDAQGAWSFTPGGLADGSHTIVASQTDSFGNTGSASLIFTLDTAAPTVAITSAGGSTNQASQTITGTVDVADAGATVTILDGTTAIGSAVVQGNGTWTTTVTLNQGSNSLTARVSDAAGNTATSGAVVYTLSTTGPTVTEGLVSDTGSSATDHVTSNPAVNGTGLANTVVHFTIDGSAVAATATTDAQGAWSFTPGGLADGSHTIVASQTDSFGNTGSASLIFTLDTAAPTVAITSAGGSTNQASQTITGTVDVADAGATVTILDGTTAIGSAVVQGNGTWTTTVTLNQGSNSLTARVSDAAGNTATSGAVVYLVGVPGAIFGDAGDNALTGTAGNDAFEGFGGNDIFNGLSGVDRAVYVDATGGITADLAAGTVTGPGVGTDTLIGIEAIQGSNFADRYSAVGFTGNSGIPGTPIGFNSFEGMGGDDIIVGTVNPSGQILTRISYASATAAVTVDLAGTASGDASVGNDTFTNVNSVIGSAFADALRGSDNPNGTFEQYDGRAGNDLIDGRGGYDFAVYNNDVTTTTGIAVNLAAGTVTGDATIGTDTLRSVEAVRGTNFADIFDSTGFSGTSTNAGSSGIFNNFEGMGGNDTIIGNGNTRLQYTQSSAGVTVDFLAGTAIGDASVGTDTFSGVNAVMGSMFADTFSGSGANENFMGLAGDDLIDGKGGFDTAQYANLTFTTGGISVHLAAGTVTGDVSSGTDTLRSIEAIQGTNFSDTYDATNFGVTGAIDPATGVPYANVGNNGTFNQFEGMGGNDVIVGNGNTRLTYVNATGPVTITFSLNSWTSTTSGASGTVTGDGSVGTDTFSDVGSVSGSSFADTITGSNNPNGTAEDFAGRAGNDFIDGKTGFDRAFYNNDGSASGIQVDMASGVVTGDAAIGTDTLRSVEAIRGTSFADAYVATNFGVSGANAGDFGTFNEFEGMAGDDAITGNGNTRIAFYNALDGITVDLAAGTSHGTAAGDVASVGTDTFTGVNAVRGSSFADLILGDANANTLEGRDGNDRLDGRAGADTLTGGNGADTFVYANGDGADTITDFDRTQGDTIDLTGMSNIFTFADVQSKATVSGGNTIIDFGSGNTLTLIGVTSLQQSDFVLPTATNGTSGSDVLLGTSQADAISGLAGNDRLQGFGGNDLLDGGTNFDRAVYTDATGGITVNLAAGTASGPGVGTDTLVGIEGAVGSDFADTFNAAGFTGATGTPGTPVGFNEFEGRGGNDTITGAVNALGAALTRVSYVSATAGVIVDIAAGTANGNASVGQDTFVGPGILSAWGSSFADTLSGSNNAFGTVEVFAGFAGNDLIDGRGGFDRVDYNNDPTTTSGTIVNLAAGSVTGDATVGTDTFVSVEAVRGTNFADTYNAVGFSDSSTNAGSLGTFNEFTGEGGNDTIVGNGNTRIGFNNATAGVVVDLAAGTATGDSSVGSDTITGINAIMGSMFTDSLSGSGINETFTGLGGNDTIDGRGGFDTASYNNIYLSTGSVTIDMASGTATGDSSIGTDTLRSIEAVQGTILADTYVATGYGLAGALNVGNNGTFNQFEGLGGDDTITGNGNTRLMYTNATGPVTITFSGWTSTTSGGSGTVTGDTSVGTDTFSGVESVSGSAFADTITGSANPNGTAEDFAGRAGNDSIDGKGGFDRAFYNNDGSASGIQVDMASGVVSGDAAIGTDTLRSVEAIRGTNFADTYVTTNFGVSGPNVGDFTTFNEFEGMGGNDTITGNGNTRIAFYNALDGVTVDLAANNSHGTASGDIAGVGTDAFTGVNAIRGSAFADVISGDAGNNTLDGQAGNDVIQGRGGADTLIGGAGADHFVFAAVSESTVVSHDTISDFVHGTDLIDISGIAGATTVQGLIAGSTQVAAHSIAWIQSGADTFVYVNSSAVAQNQGSADMEVVLTAVTAGNLTNLDFFHV